MIAIFLSPIYIAVLVILFFKTKRWLRSFSEMFARRIYTFILSFIYTFLGLLIPVAFWWPKGTMKHTLNVIADYWFGIILYLLLSSALLWIFRFIVLRVEKFKPHFWKKDKAYAACGLVILVLTFIMSFLAIRSAHTIVITKYDISVDKQAGELKDLKIALIADLHMGYNVGPEHIEKMVKKVNSLNPDIILIAGDIFDNDYDSMEKPERLIELLASMKSTYGTYATFGNHDINEQILCGFTFGGSKDKVSDPRMDDFLKKANITLMRDEYLLIDDSFYLVGRPDYEKPGRDVDKRKSPDELVKGLDMTKPIIVMDHEPREQKELARTGVDVVLNGHTHDGQTFPGNLLTNIMWDNAYGYKKYGELHNIVTSGVGYFGPIMRLGTVCEVCEVTVHFK